MIVNELEKIARAIMKRNIWQCPILYFDFKMISNLFLIIYNKLRIGSCFIDQIQFLLKEYFDLK
jgi:hypothetical protein